jgi:hypothetical protein
MVEELEESEELGELEEGGRSGMKMSGLALLAGHALL